MCMPLTASAQYGLFNEHHQAIPLSIEGEILEMKGRCLPWTDPWGCFCQGFQYTEYDCRVASSNDFADFENDPAVGLNERWISVGEPDEWSIYSVSPLYHTMQPLRVVINLSRSPGLGGLRLLDRISGQFVDSDYIWFGRDFLVRFVRDALGVWDHIAPNGARYLLPFEVVQKGDAYMKTFLNPSAMDAKFITHNGNFLFTLLAGFRDNIAVEVPGGVLELNSMRELLDYLTNPYFGQPLGSEHVSCQVNQYLTLEDRALRAFTIADFGLAEDTSTPAQSYRQVGESTYLQLPMVGRSHSSQTEEIANDIATANPADPLEHALLTTCTLDNSSPYCVRSSVVDYFVPNTTHVVFLRRIQRLNQDTEDFGLSRKSIEGTDYLEMSMYTENSSALDLRRRTNLQYHYLYTPKYFDDGSPGYPYITPESFEVEVSFDHGVGLDFLSEVYTLQDQLGGQQYAPQCILEVGVQDWN